MKNWPNKDPDEVIDYAVNWVPRLGSDTIATSAFAAQDAGITIESDSHTDTRSTVWLSGGTSGRRYKIDCTITTAGGRTMQQTVSIKVVDG